MRPLRRRLSSVEVGVNERDRLITSEPLITGTMSVGISGTPFVSGVGVCLGSSGGRHGGC